MPSSRYAICFTPPPDSPLAAFGASVIGYDCFERAEVSHRRIDGIDPAVLALATVEPRRYGFHAAFVATFHLASGREDELAEAFAAFAASHAPIAVGPLCLAAMRRRIVLAPGEPYPEIKEFGAACLAAFDRYRAPIVDAEQALHAAADLSPRQAELLERWGDPHVLDEFRFHMTLAGPFPDEPPPAFARSLAKSFGGLASDRLELDALSLMRRDEPAGRFYVHRRRRLTRRR
jgi:hypothetical protein